MRLFGRGEPMHALRLYDSIVSSAPLDFGARLHVADCLVALGEHALAAEVYRAVAWYTLKAGHPLTAVVSARVLEEVLGGEADDLMAALVVRYGSESELVGRFAARINVPPDSTQVAPPDLRAPVPDGFAAAAAHRATHCCDDFDEYPEAVHPIPLLSTLSEESFRRVLRTLVVRRLPDGTAIIRQGEPGESFYFVATGEVRVFVNDAMGRENELARLHDGSVFGEMALLSAEPRSASVAAVGEADLLEVTRQSLETLAGELEQVATALQGFTQERLLRNLMATNRLFRPFDRSQQRDLLRRFTSHEAMPGTEIIREGSDGTGLFVVLTGELAVSKAGTPLATLRAGDLVGEMSIMAGGPTTATVTAATRATVLFLAREYVERMVAGVPEIREYLQALAEDRTLDTQMAMADDDVGEDEIIFI